MTPAALRKLAIRAINSGAIDAPPDWWSLPIDEQATFAADQCVPALRARADTGDQRAALILDRSRILNGVTIHVTHFRRRKALARCLASIKTRYPATPIMVEDTGGNLSRARNRMVERTTTPFIFMIEEDMEMTARTSIEPLLDVVQSDRTIGGCTGAIAADSEKPNYWCHNFREFRGELLMEISRRPIRKTPAGVAYRPCDAIYNWGVFRTEMFRKHPWDEALELSEHRELSYRTHREWSMAFTTASAVRHYMDRPPEYTAPRQRAQQFKPIAEAKVGLRFGPPEPLTVSPKTLRQMGGTPRQNLAKAKAALDLIDCPFFLSDGTLLGCHRAGDFIPTDLDIDLGVFRGDYSPKIADAMVAVGFAHVATHGSVDDGLQYAFRRDGCKVDVFFYYQAANYSHAVWKGDQQRRYAFAPFGVEPVCFRGLDVFVPSPTERVIIEQYGDGWRKPIKAAEWDWWTSPKNLRASGWNGHARISHG